MSFEAGFVDMAYAGWISRRVDSASDPVSFFSPMAQVLFWLMVVGIVAFFFGFRWLRFERQIKDTPFSKMGSASMGLIEVSGKASGPRTIAAALTGADCFYYRAEAWQRGQSGKAGEWRRVASETMAAPFFVEDSTGKLHVRPEGAEMEVLQTLNQTYDARIYRGRESWPEPMRSFLARNGINDSIELRLEEHCIKPGETLFVIGTLGELPEMLSWDARPHFGGKRMLQVQLNGPIVRTAKASWKIERNAAGGKDWTVTRTSGPVVGRAANSADTEMIKGMFGGAASAGTTKSVVVNKFVVNRSSTGEPGAAGSGAVDLATLPPEALEEISKATGGTINAAKIGEMIRQTREQEGPHGTYGAQVPEQALKEMPKVGIGKGRRGDPFVISWRSQRDVAGVMGHRALVGLVGGPVTAVVCLYLLLLLLGKIPVGGN